MTRLAATLLAFTLLSSRGAGASAPAPPASRVEWREFFSKVTTEGAEFSEKLRSLEGKRVLLRGYAIFEPRPDGGLYLTRFPEGKLHPDDEETLPWDAVGVVWRKGIHLPKIPPYPTVEGTLRLGNRQLGTETVILLLEDALPARAAPANRKTSGTPSPAP
jgi:hypothetical protein